MARRIFEGEGGKGKNFPLPKGLKKMENEKTGKRDGNWKVRHSIPYGKGGGEGQSSLSFGLFPPKTKMETNTEKTISQRQFAEDDSLVESFQKGEISAFDKLMVRYQSRIYNLTYSILGNREDALDISQEAFLRAFRALGRFERKSAFYSWLYRIAMNLCIDFLRRRSHIPPISLDSEKMQLPHNSIPARQPSPAKLVERKELQQQINAAVAMLAPMQKKVFMLRHWDGLQIKEIADVIDRSEGTVKAHLFHAARNLRKRLAEYLEA